MSVTQALLPCVRPFVMRFVMRQAMRRYGMLVPMRSCTARCRQCDLARSPGNASNIVSTFDVMGIPVKCWCNASVLPVRCRCDVSAMSVRF